MRITKRRRQAVTPVTPERPCLLCSKEVHREDAELIVGAGWTHGPCMREMERQVAERLPSRSKRQRKEFIRNALVEMKKRKALEEKKVQ